MVGPWRWGTSVQLHGNNSWKAPFRQRAAQIICVTAVLSKGTLLRLMVLLLFIILWFCPVRAMKIRSKDFPGKLSFCQGSRTAARRKIPLPGAGGLALSVML